MMSGPRHDLDGGQGDQDGRLRLRREAPFLCPGSRGRSRARSLSVSRWTQDANLRDRLELTVQRSEIGQRVADTAAVLLAAGGSTDRATADGGRRARCSTASVCIRASEPGMAIQPLPPDSGIHFVTLPENQEIPAHVGSGRGHRLRHYRFGRRREHQDGRAHCCRRCTPTASPTC